MRKVIILLIFRGVPHQSVFYLRPSMVIIFSVTNVERVRMALEVVILERLARSSREIDADGGTIGFNSIAVLEKKKGLGKTASYMFLSKAHCSRVCNTKVSGQGLNKIPRQIFVVKYEFFYHLLGYGINKGWAQMHRRQSQNPHPRTWHGRPASQRA